MPELHRAAPDHTRDIAPLILDAAPHLRVLLGGDREAWHAAEACYRSDRTMFGYRFGMVAVDGGRTAGFIIAFPGRLWATLKLGTGVVLARAAGVSHAADLVRRGRILDRMHAAVPRDAMYISALAVHPEHRRQGLARALLQRAIAGAGGLGLGVALDVDVDAATARKLYESMGFQESTARVSSEAERRLVETAGFTRMVRPLEVPKPRG